MSQEEIHVWFPKIQKNFDDGLLTFSISNMKCRTVAVMYYIIHFYHYDGSEILVNDKPFHIGERWAVDETWSSYEDSFNVTEADKEWLDKYQIELVLINVDDSNPLYFTECMLQNGEFNGFFEPDEAIIESSIEFINNAYVNLYRNSTDNYLQIIRPTKNYFTTKVLLKSNCTVLAPHITGESPNDKPENLFMEFLYQTEQTTNFKPI